MASRQGVSAAACGQSCRCSSVATGRCRPRAKAACKRATRHAYRSTPAHRRSAPRCTRHPIHPPLMQGAHRPQAWAHYPHRCARPRWLPQCWAVSSTCVQSPPAQCVARAASPESRCAHQTRSRRRRTSAHDRLCGREHRGLTRRPAATGESLILLHSSLAA